MKTDHKLPTPEEFAQTIAKSMWGPALQNKPFRSHLEIIAQRSSLPRPSPQFRIPTSDPREAKQTAPNLVANSGSSAYGISERTFALCANSSNQAKFSVRFGRHPVNNGLVWAAVKK